MKKILLCGMKYDLNFGDAIINDCCKKIVEEILEEKNIQQYEIEEIDLTGKKSYHETYYIKKNIRNCITSLLRKVISRTKKICKKIKPIFNYLDMIEWNFTKEKMIMQKYYKEKIEQSDMIIFVGGGIVKFKYQNCYHYIDEVTKIADKLNIPVCLNAVGVEGYDNKNVKCRLLEKALNRECIKMITTRDDLEKLKKYMSDSNKVIIAKVSDCAVYSKDVYKIEKPKKSEYIGLGVSRGNLFIDNNINYTEEQLLQLWQKIIEKLKEKKMEYTIYTNGLDDDNEFAIKLCKRCNINENELILPKEPKELVHTISNFKGIIATRLHSCIVAYSLQVPAIGLVWNPKLKMFGENIQYPERFIETKDFEANKIISKLQDAIKQGYTKIKPEEYGKGVKNKLEQFIMQYFIDG